jgi:hypothetical protein
MSETLRLQLAGAILSRSTGGDRDLAAHALAGIEAALKEQGRRATFSDYVETLLSLEAPGGETNLAHVDARPFMDLGPLFLRQAVGDAARRVARFREVTVLVTGIEPRPRSRSRKAIRREEWTWAAEDGLRSRLSPQTRVRLVVI